MKHRLIYCIRKMASHGDNIITNFSIKKVEKFLSRYYLSEEPKFIDRTFDEKKQQLQIEEEEYTLKKKYKIILYLTRKADLETLLYIKEDLFWDFDFYFHNFSYPTITIIFSNCLRHLKFYFEELKVDYDYKIYDFEYSQIVGHYDINVNDLLYNSTITTIKYGFELFEYVFDKVIENNPQEYIVGNKNLLFNIINCNNPKFICDVIDEFHLDFYCINPIIRTSPLFYAFERCSLDTILFLNDKYKANIFELIKKDSHLQEFVIDYLFTYFNSKKINYCNNYIFPESEREKIFKYVIKYVKSSAFPFIMKKLRDYKNYLDFDNYIAIFNKHKLKYRYRHIKNICSTCNNTIQKKNGNIFYISGRDSYHPECCLDKEDLTKIYFNDCSICLNENESEYIILSCGHIICINCIEEFKKHSNKCCNCRTYLRDKWYIDF
jgi:hypothetical protein